ncbi:MAG: SHOCT domain-containing protein [Trebonia sp.]|uniref:SHOCT domain-containing protein n=1 Tax=Trebonia sp. TaxID=2767075 RepID=UPI003BE82140
MGILKTAATVAVASSVHGRIQRRQQQRWAAQDQSAGLAPPPAAQPPPEAAPPPQAPSTDMSERLAQLAQLSDLKNAGVLTDAEFDQQKARILNA